ncbi:MAG TPA: hypothetical protein VMX38_10845 [Verrucomicrobiae bacterium]|nr:hypothetical protein [Verrucomicrobiae bacterium]
MARLATSGKTATMRIGMAVTAVAKSDAPVAGLLVGSRSVALATSNICMQASKWIPRQRMIELRDVFPICEVVTLQTILAESSFVGVLMTIGAVRGNSEISFVEIFYFYSRAFALRNPCWQVAAIALHPSVLALKLVTCLAVIEGPDVELYDGEIFAVVL